jgi:excinuclease ABC subunit B
MRHTVEDSNRRREKQIQYNIENGIMPRQAKRNSAQPSPLIDSKESAVADGCANYQIAEGGEMRIVADSAASYEASTNIDSLIEQARSDMERAARSLDFIAAARYRDRMYELQQIKEERLNTPTRP